MSSDYDDDDYDDEDKEDKPFDIDDDLSADDEIYIYENFIKKNEDILSCQDSFLVMPNTDILSSTTPCAPFIKAKNSTLCPFCKKS